MSNVPIDSSNGNYLVIKHHLQASGMEGGWQVFTGKEPLKTCQQVVVKRLTSPVTTAIKFYGASYSRLFKH